METKRPFKILVVEDENITARALEQSLKDVGYDVVGIVAYGEEAVRKAAHVQPDLVLMDITLKGSLDGIFAAQRIQARFDIPVVYLTAHSDDETVKRAIYSNPYGYIVKPFVEQELVDIIEKALDRHESKRRK